MSTKRLFNDILTEAAKKQQTFQVGEHSVSREVLEANALVIKKMMRGDCSCPQISMKEALGSADASILFRKVINDTLIRPTEPLLVAQTQLARTIQIDNARSVTFPTLGAIRAKELGENQDYGETHPGFGEITTEVKVGRCGVLIPISEDLIADSQWDVMSLYVEAGGFAMARLKEEKCFNELADHSMVVFDNKINAATGSGAEALLRGHAQTTGVGIDGSTPNGSLTFNDLIDAIGGLITNEYMPTDITMHPLAWAIFAKDPIINYQLLQAGQVGQSVANLGPDAVRNNIPFAFNVNVTPFVQYGVDSSFKLLTSAGANTTAAEVPLTNIYITDRNQSLVILEREPLSIVDFEDAYRDIQLIKAKARYGTGVLNQGKGSVVIKNVAITQNYAPIYSVKNVTV